MAGSIKNILHFRKIYRMAGKNTNKKRAAAGTATALHFW